MCGWAELRMGGGAEKWDSPEHPSSPGVLSSRCSFTTWCAVSWVTRHQYPWKKKPAEPQTTQRLQSHLTQRNYFIFIWRVDCLGEDSRVSVDDEELVLFMPSCRSQNMCDILSIWTKSSLHFFPHLLPVLQVKMFVSASPKPCCKV